MKSSELSAVYHELTFWKNFVQTKRFLDGWVKNVKTPELRQQVHDFIKAHLLNGDKVLDAGSGVVSILNGTVPARDLITLDPLGELYRLVFDYERHRIQAPLALTCEEFAQLEGYGIVHISNALDHTQDPVKAYERLLAAVRPGGYLIIQCFEDEAIYENWQGFHQYGSSTRLSCGVEEVVSIERIPVENKMWFIYIAKKS